MGPSFRATYSRYGEGRRSEEAAVLEEHREGIEQGREEGYPILPSGGCEDKAEEQPQQLPPDEAPRVHHPRDGPNPPRGSLQGKEGQGKGESVLDLREARFVDGKVEMGRYLEGFPFRYFLVVGDVRELPGVLAGVLRSWFGEVVDAS